MREWTIACPWSSGHPADNYWLKDSPHPPLAVSLSKHRCSRCQDLVTMAKLNNGRFVNRTMCVGLRPTTAFSPSPLSFPCPHYTQDREIACNWLWIDCGWQGGACCVSAVMISEGAQPAGHHLRRVSGVSSGQTDWPELSCSCYNYYCCCFCCCWF